MSLINWDDLEAELIAARYTPKTTIEINSTVFSEFEYLHELLQKSERFMSLETTEDLINYALTSIANGSRKPGSWERGMLDNMGIVADCPEHHIYRQEYGMPKD